MGNRAFARQLLASIAETLPARLLVLASLIPGAAHAQSSPPVPLREPGTLFLLGLGLAVLGLVWRNRRKR